MNIHEFGTGNEDMIVLIHPSLVYWDYFYRVIPLLESSRHLVVPALPGYDAETASDFSSVEEIARELADWLDQQHISRVSCLYGCYLGGYFAAYLAQRGVIQIDHVIIGSSDMDEAHGFSARFQSSLISSMLYGRMKKGGIPNWVKKISEARIRKHPDIRCHDLNHEELLFCRPDEWAKEVKTCTAMKKQYLPHA